uniref:Uncharacterized protein n=1 Tax=Arundo donax TaxID=35708 RepID=A0A0A9FWU0_ARUDO
MSLPLNLSFVFLHSLISSMLNYLQLSSNNCVLEYAWHWHNPRPLRCAHYREFIIHIMLISTLY